MAYCYDDGCRVLSSYWFIIEGAFFYLVIAEPEVVQSFVCLRRIGFIGPRYRRAD
jgi:hypothetical protein